MERRPHGTCVCTMLVLAAVVAIAALISARLGESAIPSAHAAGAQTANAGKWWHPRRLAVEGDLPSFTGATAWINSQPLKPTDLRGKVVLVEFWTYTCINWRRQFPYVRAWADKYRDKGLVVIGVHSPEFVFEKDVDNVRRLTKEIGVPFPVAVDSDNAIWRAFNNEYWPALYFVDAQGRVRHHQFGEGDYEQSEMVIKQLLAEAGATGIDSALVSDPGVGPEAAADWDDLMSPENYTGYEKAEGFTSPGGLVQDKAHAYTTPAHLAVNEWALSGDWTIEKDMAQSHSGAGQLTYRFHARDLNLVMGPSMPRTAIRFRVLIDGHAPGAAHGTDVDEQGYGTISEPRMYQLIRQSKPIGDKTFTITFLDAGAETFCFTFG